MKQNLSSKKLLESLDKFVQEMHELNRADNPKLISQLAVRWTKAQPLLTKKLLQYILESKLRIALGQESLVVEKIIRTRLLKEFKHDELTLPIRKMLYTKDLVRLLSKKRKIADTEKIYLRELQNELGLSLQEGQSIKEKYLSSGQLANVVLTNSPARAAKNNAESEILAVDSYQELISLVESSSVYQQISAENLVKNAVKKRLNISKLLNYKGLWFCLAIPLLWLTIKTIQGNQKSQIVTEAVHAENGCSDLAHTQLSNISLGDKLLTHGHSDFEPLNKIALYEATAAFTRCEYPLALGKFQTALRMKKNNPEALIYLNNARAMSSTSSAIANDYLKIAVNVPMSESTEAAWEILRGVAQAQTEINQQGGIEGKLLSVLIVDAHSETALTDRVAEKLAADPSILAVISYDDDRTSLAASKTYQDKGLVAVYPTSSDSKISQVGNYIFRTAPDVSALAKTLASYALVNSWERIAVCSDSHNSTSVTFVREFSQATIDQGGEIIPIDCDFARENFNPVLAVEQANASNANALLLAAGANRTDRAISVAQANQNRLPLLGSPSLYTFKTIEAGAAVAEMVLATPWIPETTAQSNFFVRAQELWGGKVNWRTALSYDATKAIIQGLKQSDNRQTLQSVLTNTDSWAGGKTGDRDRQAQLIQIVQSEQNSHNYRFLPLNIQGKTNSVRTK